MKLTSINYSGSSLYYYDYKLFCVLKVVPRHQV